MLALLAAAGGLIEKAVGHFAGSHVAGALFRGVPIPAARAIADGLGLRGLVGFLLATWLFGPPAFRHGLTEALKALLP